MAPLPKRRHSTARGGKRRKAWTLTPILLVDCPNCGQPKRPHTMCSACGQYNSRVVLLKKTKKRKEVEKP